MRDELCIGLTRPDRSGLQLWHPLTPGLPLVGSAGFPHLNAPDGRLRLRAFGGFRLSRPTDEMEEANALRRPVAVLAAVDVAGDRGISRDKLLGLLWPDTDADRARHSLTQAIYNARRATGIDDLFLMSGSMRLNRERISSDVDDFERALEARDLETAVALYEGPFLDGFFLSGSPDFEQWISAQRLRFERLAVSALEELAARATDAGDLRRAIEWRRRVTAIRPLDSSASAALISALAQAGDRAGAMQHAQEHAATLRDELALEPDPAFAAMVARLREPGSAAAIRETLSQPVGEPQGFREFSSPVAGVKPRASRRLLAGAAVVATMLIAAVWYETTRPAAFPVTRDGGQRSRLFVAPFDASGASAPLSYLGRGAAESSRINSRKTATFVRSTPARSPHGGAKPASASFAVSLEIASFASPATSKPSASSLEASSAFRGARFFPRRCWMRTAWCSEARSSRARPTACRISRRSSRRVCSYRKPERIRCSRCNTT